MAKKKKEPKVNLTREEIYKQYQSDWELAERRVGPEQKKLKGEAFHKYEEAIKALPDED